MAEEILINITPREVRIALLENNVLQEIHVERTVRQGLLGNIYKGRVSRLLPGIQAAFVDIGLDRSAFLHLNDLSGYENKNHTAEGGAQIDIRDILRVGQELLVQVYKDPLGSKGARLTTQFTIPSRYLVLTPGIHQMAVSQKIVDEVERERLLNLLTPGPQGGFIFRTVAEGVRADELVADHAFLNTLWLEVEARVKTAKLGDVVYEEIPIILRVLRDFAGHQVEKIWVDNLPAMNAMQEFASRYVPALSNRLEYYDDPNPIFDWHGVEDELQKTLLRQVYLKSGGHLVFDQTEAMTTVDVNTGSYLGHDNMEQAIYKTNLEAADAIARQVRLRNLGGIIIIDFIDMMDESHKPQLMESLRLALAKDSVRTEVSELSRLGLVQMTRKRSRDSLEHVLCVPCPLCQRRGFVKSFATISYDIFREIKRVAELFSWAGYEVLASQRVVDYIRQDESEMLADLEAELTKPIKLRVEPTYTQENFDILPMLGKE